MGHSLLAVFVAHAAATNAPQSCTRMGRQLCPTDDEDDNTTRSADPCTLPKHATSPNTQLWRQLGSDMELTRNGASEAQHRSRLNSPLPCRQFGTGSSNPEACEGRQHGGLRGDTRRRSVGDYRRCCRDADCACDGTESQWMNVSGGSVTYSSGAGPCHGTDPLPG